MDWTTFGEGRLIELLDQGLEELLQNVTDPNIPPEPKRSFTVTLEWHPKKGAEREQGDIIVTAKTRLAPPRPFLSTVFIGRNADGVLEAEEAAPRHDPRQNYLPGEGPRILSIKKGGDE